MMLYPVYNENNQIIDIIDLTMNAIEMKDCLSENSVAVWQPLHQEVLSSRSLNDSLRAKQTELYVTDSLLNAMT